MTRRAPIAEAHADDDFVPFSAAGEHAKGEFRCAECGYGVTVCRELPVCPMCSGVSWEAGDWSPFARAPDDPLHLSP